MSLSFHPSSKIGSIFLSGTLVFGGLGMTFFMPHAVFAANPVRVYVAGESIERRNCFANAPFTASGALNRPTDDNDIEYGWMIPMAERLKLRQPGLGIQFVGAQPWAEAEDNDYNSTECGFVPAPGRTSAISGSSVGSWLDERAGELSARTYCYDVAFASRGGNDGGASHEEYRDQLKDLVRRLAHGSSCQTNPVIYVTGHMPDNQGSVSTLRARFSTDPRQVVDELHASDPGLNVRFIDIFSAFASNQPTTAFPTPAWLSSTNTFNIARIGRDADGLHPRRLSSIYAGEVAANAIDLNEFTGGASTGSGSSSGSGTTTTVPPPIPAPTPTPTPAPVPLAPVPAPEPITVVRPEPVVWVPVPLVTSPPHVPAVTVPALPNLQGTLSRIAQTCRRVGSRTRCTVRGTITIRNSGTRVSSASRVRVSVITNDGRTRLLQTISVPRTAVNQTRTYVVNRLLPLNLRGVTLIGVLDANNQVRESNEGDNRIEARLP